MGFAHAWIEDALSRLVLVAVLAVLALGAYELSRLRQEVQALSSAVAAMKTDVQPAKADVDEDADEDDHDCADDDAVTPESNPELLYQQAQDAYVHGQYAHAMLLSEDLIETQPAKGWRVFGASACFLKDRPNAMQAYKRLDPPGRDFLRYVCARNQITLR